MLAAQSRTTAGTTNGGNAHGKLSRDWNSPPREVPALENVLDGVLIADTVLPVVCLPTNWRLHSYLKSCYYQQWQWME
jgi:hypothetical protein